MTNQLDNDHNPTLDAFAGHKLGGQPADIGRAVGDELAQLLQHRDNVMMVGMAVAATDALRERFGFTDAEVKRFMAEWIAGMERRAAQQTETE